MQAFVAVVDGIGHGEHAAAAAHASISFLGADPWKAMPALIQGCHEALRRTRGVVMSLIQIDATADKLTWVGVGNVEGQLISPTKPTRAMLGSIPLRGGVVGARLPALSPSTIPIAPGDLLVVATDGISAAFADDLVATADPVQKIADRILAQHGRENDDALVLVARYRGLER